MPTRRTTRGAERTPLGGEYDVLICGASFAGLTVARELTGSGARVLVLDRYEIGERQTSACGIPTEWLRAMGLMGSHRQTFGRLVVHTPYGTSRLELPWTFSTFDYPSLCELLAAQSDHEFETAKVNGRTGDVVHTDRGDLSAPLIVDALGWRRVLGSGYQPPDAPLSRGLEVHPWGVGEDMELWIDRKYVPAGYGWSFPAGDETRIGVGSFDPRFHVKDTTVMLAEDLERDAGPLPGQLDPAQAARRHRRRRVLRGRQRRPLPSADRRGHPDRVLLRDRLRPRVALRCGRQAVDRLRPRPLRRLLGGAPLEVRGDAGRPEARPARAAAPAAPLDQRDAGEALPGLELRALPGDRARRSSRRRGRRPAAPAGPQSPSPPNPFDPYFSFAFSKKASRFRKKSALGSTTAFARSG